MSEHLTDEHDLGLHHDLQMIARQRMERRRALGWLVSAGTAALVAGCGGESGDSTTSTSSSSTDSSSSSSSSSSSGSSSSSSSGSTSSGSSTTCVADPTETNGPYPADGSNSANGSVANALIQSGIIRSDIRSSFGSATGIATGVWMEFTITVVDVSDGCTPLAGYAVYIWHCTRTGTYSIYNDTSANYLRGVQITDANGQLTFTTIFPGCYAGRYPHIHFEVYPSEALATSNSNAVLISQFALPSAACSTVYATSEYSGSRSNFASTSISGDNVFGDNTSAQVAAQTLTMTGDVTNGYTATATVGLA